MRDSTLAPGRGSVDVDRVIADAVAVGDQADDAPNVASYVGDVTQWGAVMDVPADNLVFAECYDREIFVVFSLEVPLGSRRRCIQAGLKFRRNFDADK